MTIIHNKTIITALTLLLTASMLFGCAQTKESIVGNEAATSEVEEGQTVHKQNTSITYNSDGTVDTSAWEIHRDEMRGIEVRYPKDWDFSKSVNHTLKFNDYVAWDSNDAYLGQSSTLTVSSGNEPIPNWNQFTDYIQFFSREETMVLHDSRALKKELWVPNEEALKRSYTSERDNLDRWRWAYVCDHDKQRKEAYLCVSYYGHKDLLPVFDAFLKTLKRIE